MLEFRALIDGKWANVPNRRGVQQLMRENPGIAIEWREISDWRRVTEMPAWLLADHGAGLR